MSSLVQFFLIPLSPILALSGTAMGLIAFECVPQFRLPRTKFVFALAGSLLSLACCLWLYQTWPIAYATTGAGQGDMAFLLEFARQFRLDGFSVIFFAAIAAFTTLAVVFLNSQFRESDIRSEIFILLFFIASGMMLLVSADSLLMVFMGIELLSLPTYVLVGIQRRDKASCEAALKYFLFGSFATVLLVLSMALLYAHFRTMSFLQMSEMLRTHGAQPSVLLQGGLALLLVAVAFKVGVVPFHMWVPDTYQGAPTSVTGFMGSAVKLAGFALTARLLWGVFLPASAQWTPILNVLAVATMFVGNLAALAQDNLKRMFAYSSVSHAGYLLLAISAVTSGNAPAANALYFYLVVYGLGFLGLFAILHLIEQSTGSSDIFQLSGMGFTHPVMGLCVALFALSAAGIPPTAGFFAKYFVFMDAVRAGNIWLVVLGLVSSLIGVYYYLRVIVYLYMKESRERLRLPTKQWLTYAGILICAFSTLYFALFPQALGIGRF